MKQAFWGVFGQMMIVLILLLIGYTFNRKKWIPKETEIVLSKLVTLLFLPCLTLNTFLTRCTMENLREYGSLVLYGAGMSVTILAISYPIGRLLSPKDDYKAAIVRYCVTFPNTGAVGTPLMLALYGTMGHFQLSLFTLANNILCYSWGIAQLLPSDGKKTFWQRIRSVLNPNFIAMAVGAVLGVSGIAARLPDVVFSGLERVGTGYTVASLILTGYVIANYKPREIFGDRSVYAMTALRLILLPALLLGAARLLHASQTLMLVACMTVVCPCGMNTVVFPAAYRKDSRFGASLVLISSALSLITVPLIYALVTAL